MDTAVEHWPARTVSPVTDRPETPVAPIPAAPEVVMASAPTVTRSAPESTRTPFPERLPIVLLVIVTFEESPSTVMPSTSGITFSLT